MPKHNHGHNSGVNSPSTSPPNKTPHTTPRAAPTVLAFAGLDPSGGAGLQADIETLLKHGVHTLPIATALTAQDTHNLHALWPVDESILRQQVETLTRDVTPAAIKIGLLGSIAAVEIIATTIDALRKHNPALPVVFDPVLASGAGRSTIDPPLLRSIHEQLLPRATIITPNQSELLQLESGQHNLATNAEVLSQNIDAWCLMTGADANTSEVNNHLYHQGALQRSWQWPRIKGQFHGTGCSLASAITANLVLDDQDNANAIEQAIEEAQHYSQQTIRQAFAIDHDHGQLIPQRLPIHFPK